MASMYYENIRKPPAIDPDVIRPLFGLSPAEANLAVLIAAGFALCEAARTLNVTRETSRNMIKKVFYKTDTHRQSELAVLLLQTTQ